MKVNTDIMTRLREKQLENDRLRSNYEKVCAALAEERDRHRDATTKLQSLASAREQMLDQVMDKTAQAEAVEAKNEALHEFHLTALQAEREKREAERRALLREAEREQRRLQGELHALTERQGAWNLEREHLREQVRARAPRWPAPLEPPATPPAPGRG